MKVAWKGRVREPATPQDRKARSKAVKHRLKEATREMRKEIALASGTRTQMLACPLCGMQKPMRSTGIDGEPRTPHFGPYDIVARSVAGGGSFQVPRDLYDRIVEDHGSAPRRGPSLGLGFFTEAEYGFAWLKESEPAIFAEIAKAVHELAERIDEA